MIKISFLLKFVIPFAIGLGLKVSCAQALREFEIRKVDTAFSMNFSESVFLPKNLEFGGISALEINRKGDFIMISDRQTPSPKPENQYSWMFISDSLGRMSTPLRFFGIKNVESIRWKDKLWYAFETDEYTGLGYIDGFGNPVDLEKIEMDKSSLTAPNRGIEGLALNQDLWYAFEGGNEDSTVFIRWPNFDKQQTQSYKYPLDRKSCLSDHQIAGGSLGNGVSEILDIPGFNDRLLVLERCFNGRGSFIKIFEAKISNDTFIKYEVFDWRPDMLFNGHLLKPDNMEGMAWGNPLNGKHTLYIVSDDNHNTRHQRTILVSLAEK